MCESMEFYIIDITIYIIIILFYFIINLTLYNCLFIIYNASAKLNISLIVLLLFYTGFAYVILFCIFKHPNKIFFT